MMLGAFPLVGRRETSEYDARTSFVWNLAEVNGERMYSEHLGADDPTNPLTLEFRFIFAQVRRGRWEFEGVQPVFHFS
jgi:hypothetical protein